MTFTLVYQSQISIHSVCLGKYKDNLWLNQILSEGLLTPYVCVCVCVCGGGGGGGGTHLQYTYYLMLYANPSSWEYFSI